MKHFSEQTWIDFVRATGQAKANREIEAHLARKCPECVLACGRWKQLYAMAAIESDFAIPDHLADADNAELASAQLSEPEPWVLASTVFDSVNRPAAAGARSGLADTRQMLFDAEGTMVDLLLELHPQTNMVSLIGQVVRKDNLGVAPRQASVVSWTETGQRLAKASANEYGEFRMEFAAQDRLRLSVEIVGSKPIRIPPLTLS